MKLHEIVLNQTLSLLSISILLFVQLWTFFPDLRFGSMVAWRPFTWGIAGALAVLAAIILERHGYVGRSPWFVELGNASYSIYLIHGLVLHVTAKLVAALHLGPWANAILITVAGLAFTIAIGVLLFRAIELPLNLKLRMLFGLETKQKKTG